MQRRWSSRRRKTNGRRAANGKVCTQSKRCNRSSSERGLTRAKRIIRKLLCDLPPGVRNGPRRLLCAYRYRRSKQIPHGSPGPVFKMLSTAVRHNEAGRGCQYNKTMSYVIGKPSPSARRQRFNADRRFRPHPPIMLLFRRGEIDRVPESARGVVVGCIPVVVRIRSFQYN